MVELGDQKEKDRTDFNFRSDPDPDPDLTPEKRSVDSFSIVKKGSRSGSFDRKIIMH